MECFPKINNTFQLFTIISKHSILHVWLGSRNASANYQLLIQPAFTCSKLTIEPVEQGEKYAQS